MELQAIGKSDHDLFIQNLIKNHQVEGVKRKDDAFFYGPIKSPEELCLDFDWHCRPLPKVFLAPGRALVAVFTVPLFRCFTCDRCASLYPLWGPSL